jgi:hypothetical protein
VRIQPGLGGMLRQTRHQSLQPYSSASPCTLHARCKWLVIPLPLPHADVDVELKLALWSLLEAEETLSLPTVEHVIVLEYSVEPGSTQRALMISSSDSSALTSKRSSASD